VNIFTTRVLYKPQLCSIFSRTFTSDRCSNR